MAFLVVLLVVLGTSIWVAIDSSTLGARKGVLGGGFLDMGPVGGFFGCLLVWIVVFPCYLVARPKLVAVKQGRLAPNAFPGYPPPQPGPQPTAWAPTNAVFCTSCGAPLQGPFCARCGAPAHRQ